MNFKLHTSDIQRLILAVICNDVSDDVLSEGDKQRLLNKLTELNKMVNKENDWALNVTVEG